MISKKISANPVINADRWFDCTLTLKQDEIIISGVVVYRDANGIQIRGTDTLNLMFSTKDNMVDMQGHGVDMIQQEVKDEEGNPTGETTWVYPEGSIPEYMFLQYLPADTFPDATLWGRIERLVSMRIDRLDAQGRFNQ